MDPRTALSECRVKIDDVDRRIVALLNERTLTVQTIGRIKADGAMAIYEPKREDEVFHNVASSNAGPLDNDAIKRIFERIIDEMRKVQRDRMEQEKC